MRICVRFFAAFFLLSLMLVLPAAGQTIEKVNTGNVGGLSTPVDNSDDKNKD